MGAWIEIRVIADIDCKGMCVAPLVGAWIEIEKINGLAHINLVAPLVGAWIEIRSSYSQCLGL